MYLGKKGGGAAVGNDDARGPGQLLPLHLPRGRRVRRLGRRSPGQGRAGLRLPDRGHARSSRSWCCRPTPSRSRWAPGAMAVERAQGEPAGDPDLRQPGRLRRRPEPGRRRAARRRGDGGPRDGGQPGGRPGALHRQARCAAGRRRWRSLTGKPADPKLNVPSRVQLDRRPSSWARTTSSSGRGRSTGWPWR